MRSGQQKRRDNRNEDLIIRTKRGGAGIKKKWKEALPLAAKKKSKAEDEWRMNRRRTPSEWIGLFLSLQRSNGMKRHPLCDAASVQVAIKWLGRRQSRPLIASP